MTDAVSWLRAEIAADRDTLAAMSAADYVRALVDTLLAGGLWARSSIHACTYAIFYAERGADTTVSLFDRPIDAPAWRPIDDVTASLLSVWVLAWVTTPLIAVPSDPLVAAVVIAQALPLALDPVASIWEVAADD